jgi:hypothetical protein
MREKIEFRVSEDFATQYLPPDCGKRLTPYFVRKIDLDGDDPLLLEISRLDKMLIGRGRGGIFTSWNVRRYYSHRELESAELLYVVPKRVFEPAGEECGTVYDEAQACPECGAGAVQTTPLFLKGGRIPRNVNFARTIAEEIIVTSRVVDLFRENGLRGAEFEPIRLSNRRGDASQEHFQLNVVGPRIELDLARTRTGGDLFDESGEGRCSQGHVAGLALLSEVAVQRQSVPNADIVATKQMVGIRGGVIRPRPILLLSPKAWRAIESAKLGGLTVEVAHLV